MRRAALRAVLRHDSACAQRGHVRHAGRFPDRRVRERRRARERPRGGGHRLRARRARDAQPVKAQKHIRPPCPHLTPHASFPACRPAQQPDGRAAPGGQPVRAAGEHGVVRQAARRVSRGAALARRALPHRARGAAVQRGQRRARAAGAGGPGGAPADVRARARLRGAAFEHTGRVFRRRGVQAQRARGHERRAAGGCSAVRADRPRHGVISRHRLHRPLRCGCARRPRAHKGSADVISPFLSL